MKRKLISCLIILLAIVYLGVAIPAASLTGTVHGEFIPTAPIPWNGYPIDENYPIGESNPVWEGYPVWEVYPVWDAYLGQYVYRSRMTNPTEATLPVWDAYPIPTITPDDSGSGLTEYPVEPVIMLAPAAPRPVKLLRSPQLFQLHELLQVIE